MTARIVARCRVSSVLPIPFGLFALSLLGIIGGAGSCHEPTGPQQERTLLDELHALCFSGSVDCESLEVDGLLYLDTVNLPTNNVNIQKLVLSSLPTTPIADGNDRLEYFFEDSNQLPPEIDPGILDELGWKMKIVSARLKYCDTCYTNYGLAKVIEARGSLADAEFIYDPEDTLDIYVRTKVMP